MTKKETYEEVIPQIRSLISGETDEISVMANVAAVLHTTFDEFFWTGFYLVREGELRLSFPRPFGLHAYPIRTWCLWNGMERGTDASGSRRRTVSRTHRLFVVEPLGDCCSSKERSSGSGCRVGYRQ